MRHTGERLRGPQKGEGGVSCSTRIPSIHRAQSPVLGWEGSGWEILTHDMLSHCL